MSTVAAILVFAAIGLMLGGLVTAGIACLLVALGIYLCWETFA